jgi:2-amino-4-hydroxy-6-hydroxymethyldihydropteridine diphosphokinase
MEDVGFHDVAVALGANLGDPRWALRSARAQLQRQFSSWGGRDVRFSQVWETEPVGPPQPRYLNAVMAALVPTSLRAEDVLAFLLGVEAGLGRVRRERWGPRTLDLDLLYLGDTAVDSPGLTLPHPRAAERGFVLWPLLDVRDHAPLRRRGHEPLLPLAHAAGREGMSPVSAADQW